MPRLRPTRPTIANRLTKSGRAVTWRSGDVRDPALSSALAGADAVVHLATDRGADSDPSQRRALNLRGTETLLTATAAAGVARAVLVTSAMVYGADPDNAVPLAEDGPLVVCQRRGRDV